MQRISFKMAALAFALAQSAQAMAGDIAVVVAASSPAGAITAAQASDVFLGKNATLPGAGKMIPVDQAEGASAREEFYNKVASKSGAQMKAYWAKQIFTGTITPPKAVGDNAGVKAAVAKTPNTIGYIDKSAVDGSVKVLVELK
ncbi:MAG: phosphate ABC transporter substrate-binding protein [Gammaproteobacteria bacterium]